MDGVFRVELPSVVVSPHPASHLIEGTGNHRARRGDVDLLVRVAREIVQTKLGGLVSARGVDELPVAIVE